MPFPPDTQAQFKLVTEAQLAALGHVRTLLERLAAVADDDDAERVDRAIEALNDYQLALSELADPAPPDAGACIEVRLQDQPSPIPSYCTLEGFLAANQLAPADEQRVRLALAGAQEVHLQLDQTHHAILRPLTAEERAGRFVCIYHHTREYGGPEEGGWYYDQFEPWGFHPFSAETLAAKQAEAAEENKSLRDLSSVLATYRVAVRVEDHPPRREPAERPVYS